MANETGAELEFLKQKYGKHARLLNVEEEEDICELMREYKDSCTRELSARIKELEADREYVELRKYAVGLESEVRELKAEVQRLWGELGKFNQRI